MTAGTIQVSYTLFEVKLRFATALLILVLLLPTNGWAQSVLSLSCDDVVKIEVWRLRGEVWHSPSKEGYCYALIVELTEGARKRMQQVYDSTEKTPFMVGDHRYHIKRIDIWVGKRRILSEAPTHDNFSGPGPIIIKKTKEAAFEAARMICADKVENALFTDGS